jgi:hypothetical protein
MRNMVQLWDTGDGGFLYFNFAVVFSSINFHFRQVQENLLCNFYVNRQGAPNRFTELSEK